MTYANVASAVISAYGAYNAKQAGKKAGKKTPAEQALEAQQLATLKFLQPYGQGMLAQGSQANAIPFAHYTALAGGDRNAALDAMSPELSAYDQSQRAGMGALAEQGQRGGASADVLSRLPFQRAQQSANMLGNARQNAFGGLAQMGSNFNQLGLNALTGGMAGNMSMQQQGLDFRKNAFEEGQASGRAFGNSLQGMADAYRKWDNSRPPNNNNAFNQQATNGVNWVNQWNTK